jgi:hypothetical protein
MPGAGTAQIAYRPEDSYLTADIDGTWRSPGFDLTIDELTIDNQLERVRDPNDVMSVGSVAGNAPLNASISGTLTDSNWLEDLLPFEDDGNGNLVLSGEGGIPPTAEWAFGTTALDSSFSQFDEFITFSGAGISQADVEYQEGGKVTWSMQILGSGLTDATPSSITVPTEDQVYTHHGTTISVGSRSQSGAQSASLSLSNLARRVEGQDRTPYALVIGDINAEFATDAIFSEVDQLEAATGSSPATSIGDLIDGEDGTFEFENGNATTIGFDLDNVQPTNYSWANLVEGDLTEPVNYHTSGVTLNA